MTAQPPEGAETWEAHRLARDARNEQLCEVLGLDLLVTTGVSIEVRPGERPVVTWTGKRYVTADEFGRVIEAFQRTDDPGPPFT